MSETDRPENLSRVLVDLLAAGDIDSIADLYEERAVFADFGGSARGLDHILASHRQFVDSGNSLQLNKSFVLEADDLALVHWSWMVSHGDGRVTEGVSAEVLRRQPNGNWKFIIDNSDGADLLETD